MCALSIQRAYPPLAGEVLTPNISARRQTQLSTLRQPRDGLGMRGGSSRPLRTQPKCTSRRGHRHRRGASCRCAGAARAAKRPAVRSTRRPRPASCTRTLWGTSGWTRRSPQSCETGTGGAGRARGRCRCATFGLSVLSRGAIYHREQRKHIIIAFIESSKRMPKAAAAADDRVDQGSLWRMRHRPL